MSSNTNDGNSDNQSGNPKAASNPPPRPQTTKNIASPTGKEMHCNDQTPRPSDVILESTTEKPRGEGSR